MPQVTEDLEQLEFTMKLLEIWRYPVKSLSGERLERAVLNPGLGLPHDRRWKSVV